MAKSKFDDPYLLASTILHAICLVLTDDQRLKVAANLREYAERINEEAESMDEQSFGADVASLAALAKDGPDAAMGALSAERALLDIQTRSRPARGPAKP